MQDSPPLPQQLEGFATVAIVVLVVAVGGRRVSCVQVEWTVRRWEDVVVRK